MPKRTILYLGWGEMYVQEAVASAQTASFLEIDSISVTTEESLLFLPKTPPFSRIITHSFNLPGLLAKSE